jgi:hypothetical protein
LAVGDRSGAPWIQLGLVVDMLDDGLVKLCLGEALLQIRSPGRTWRGGPLRRCSCVVRTQRRNHHVETTTARPVRASEATVRLQRKVASGWLTSSQRLMPALARNSAATSPVPTVGCRK